MRTAMRKDTKVQKPMSAKKLTVPVAVVPSLPLKRKPGRPKKEVPTQALAVCDPDFAADKKIVKAKQSFSKAMIDAEKMLMTKADFDGGGTSADAFTVTKESLQRRVTRRLNVLDRYLTDDKLLELMTMSSLKEIGIYEGIMMDKSLVLQGQPTVIIGNDDRQAINNLLPRILGELRRRGMVSAQGQPIIVNP